LKEETEDISDASDEVGSACAGSSSSSRISSSGLENELEFLQNIGIYLQVHIASQPRRTTSTWRQYVSLKCWYPHSITNQKTNIDIFTVVRTSNLTLIMEKASTRTSILRWHKFLMLVTSVTGKAHAIEFPQCSSTVP
jgi:hypothetical protein